MITDGNSAKRFTPAAVSPAPILNISLGARNVSFSWLIENELVFNFISAS